MTNKPQGTDKSSPAPSEEVLLATANTKYVWAKTWRLVLMILSLGLLLLMATPLAREIAGQNTNVNVNVNIAANVTLALTTMTGYGYGARQRNRAKHLDERNKRLHQRVEDLQKQLEASKLDNTRPGSAGQE